MCIVNSCVSCFDSRSSYIAPPLQGQRSLILVPGKRLEPNTSAFALPFVDLALLCKHCGRMFGPGFAGGNVGPSGEASGGATEVSPPLYNPFPQFAPHTMLPQQQQQYEPPYLPSFASSFNPGMRSLLPSPLPTLFLPVHSRIRIRRERGSDGWWGLR